MFDESAERAAIAELGRAMRDAWNRGDAAGYAELFTEDADYVAFNGASAHGRQAIEDGHRWLFEGPLAGSRMGATEGQAEESAPESLRFVRPDVAIMVTSGGIAPAGQAEPGSDRESVQTTVLVKDQGTWRFAAFHNTRRQELS